MNPASHFSAFPSIPTMAGSPCTWTVDDGTAFDLAIPATFTAEQVESILALHDMIVDAKSGVAQLLKSLTPTRFSAAQAECIRELLSLNVQDFHATLADAMELCPLRDRLRASARRARPMSCSELRVARAGVGQA